MIKMKNGIQCKPLCFIAVFLYLRVVYFIGVNLSCKPRYKFSLQLADKSV